jgi:hypothetical protein
LFFLLCCACWYREVFSFVNGRANPFFRRHQVHPFFFRRSPTRGRRHSQLTPQTHHTHTHTHTAHTHIHLHAERRVHSIRSEPLPQYNDVEQHCHGALSSACRTEWRCVWTYLPAERRDCLHASAHRGETWPTRRLALGYGSAVLFLVFLFIACAVVARSPS